MPIVCIVRPNRTEQRLWNECDVARVASYAVTTNARIPGIVVSTVGKRLGYPVLIDGRVLKDSELIAKQVAELIGNSELIQDLLLAIPGGVVLRLVLRLITAFSGTFAVVIAYFVDRIISGHLLPPPSGCKRT